MYFSYLWKPRNLKDKHTNTMSSFIVIPYIMALLILRNSLLSNYHKISKIVNTDYIRNKKVLFKILVKGDSVILGNEKKYSREEHRFDSLCF